MSKVKKSAVMVLGTHKSGTSMTARALNLAGCAMPKSVVKFSAYGHEKHAGRSLPITKLNSDILASAGSACDDWHPFNEAWYQSPIVCQYKERAQNILKEEFGNSSLFMLEDTQLCRLLPFWMSVVSEYGIEPCVVAPIRDPQDIFASLGSDDGAVDHSVAHLIWLRHVLDSEANSREFKRIFVRYEDLKSNLQETIDRVQKELDISWPKSSGRHSKTGKDILLSSEYSHNKDTDDGLLSSIHLPSWVRVSYEIFHRWAGGDANESDVATLDEIKSVFDEAASIFGRALAISDDRARRVKEAVGERDHNIKLLEGVVGERDQHIESLERTVGELNQCIEYLEETANEQSGHAGYLEGAVDERGRRIGHLEGVVDERTRHIGRLEGVVDERTRLIGHLESAVGEHARRIGHLKGQVGERTRRIEHLEGVVGERTRRIEHLEGVVGERARRIEHLEEVVGERTRRIENLEAVVGERDRRIGYLEEAIGERDRHIKGEKDAQWQVVEQKVYGQQINTSELGRRVLRSIDTTPINSPVKLIAFYLPQFYPIPENNKWWGRGFTEWTNVAKAVPNYVGHYQPRLPGDVGFYDLRVEEVMEQQAEIAQQYGIYGFCYHYYWFGGHRLLEMPLERMLETGKPNIPFCLSWANEDWTRTWDGRSNNTLISQRHSEEDDIAVIHDLSRYIMHPNYIRINGKPLLLVYRIELFPNISQTVSRWREFCLNNGVGEIYLALVGSFKHALHDYDLKLYGMDAIVEYPPHYAEAPIEPPGEIINPNFEGQIYDYPQIAKMYVEKELTPGIVKFRGIIPSWDNTARRQNRGRIYHGSTPEVYKDWLKYIIHQTREKYIGDERMVFINAWNEWAEGAYLEPDRKYGYAYLDATRVAIEEVMSEDEEGVDNA